MGEVYHARDIKLGREVAVKVLPEAFAENKERLARFEREARLLASLNHPNIAAIHELEESDGVHFLALEYVPGETLAEHIRRGPIPIDEALPLFKQIAEGLEAAHENGIIHRDLKPANIKVTPEGKVKVLDFGLGKALAGEAVVHDLSQSPTLTRDATETGVLLGTAPYMSPEQARGKPVDKRTDIWAFGCCLYEALTGKAAFLGETVSDTIAAILEREPDWQRMPENTPTIVRSLVSRCLKKDPARRIHDIADAGIEIEEALTAPWDVHSLTPPASRSTARSKTLPWAFAGVTTALVALALWSFWPRSLPPPRVIRTTVKLPAGQILRTVFPVLTISPDGNRIVYDAWTEGRPNLYTRELHETSSTLLPGTEGALCPFFSPDGEWIGFFVPGELQGDYKLKKMRLDDPIAVSLANGVPRGAGWGTEGTIVFTPGINTGLMKVTADGGEPEALTTLDSDRGERSHRWPQMLPDGKGVIFSIYRGGSYDEGDIVVQSLKTGERRFLTKAACARYVPTGHLIYSRGHTLFASPFDLGRLEMSGTAVPVLTDVDTMPGGPGSAHFAFSQNGILLYVDYLVPNSRLFLVDREGKSVPIPAPPMLYEQARFSPDGQRLALMAMDQIHLYDLERNRSSLLLSQFKDPQGTVWQPRGLGTWSPDGKYLGIYARPLSAGSDHAPNIFVLSTDGSGQVERPTPSERLQKDPRWAEDGSRLVYAQQDPDTDWDIWELPLVPKGPARAVITAARYQIHPVLSPDGRFLAYTSNDSGGYEVYVTSCENPARRLQISIGGGRSPLWAPNGKSIYYRWQDNVMGVAIDTEPGLSAGDPKLLFHGDYAIGSEGDTALCDISPDGQNFVMIQFEGDYYPTEFQVVQNWFEELERLVPTEN